MFLMLFRLKIPRSSTIGDPMCLPKMHNLSPRAVTPKYIDPLGVDALVFVGEIHKEPIKVLHYGVILPLHGLHPLVLEQEHWAPKLTLHERLVSSLLYSPRSFIGTLCSYIGVSLASHEHLLEVKPFITLPTFNIIKVAVRCCYF